MEHPSNLATLVSSTPGIVPAHSPRIKPHLQLTQLPEVLRNELLDPDRRSRLSRYNGFLPGTRELLGRELESAFSWSACAMACVAIASCLYTLYAQFSGCCNGWLLFYLLIKESCFLVIVLGSVSFGIWRSLRQLVSTGWIYSQLVLEISKRQQLDSIVKVALTAIDELGHQYTGILLMMGKNSSNVVRVCELTRMIRNRQLNQSRKDFDALLLSVSNLCFSLFIMYSSKDNDDVDHSLFLSIAFSLFSLLFFLCYEKAVMQAHFDALTDLNNGKLTNLEIMVYLSKLQEDFLYDSVSFQYVSQLQPSMEGVAPRKIPDSDLVTSVQDTVSKMSWLQYAKSLAKAERDWAKHALRAEAEYNNQTHHD